MLTEAEYAVLYEALQTKNLTLLNTPAQYAHCHYLPNCYAEIEAFTPKSIWMSKREAWDLDEIVAEVQAFGPKAAIVKDYVKSRKHEWHEACFIPSTNDADAVRRVVSNFIERQGDDLQGGLIFREFIPLLPAGTHPRSGMPLTQEWRSLVQDGKVIEAAPYWDVQCYCESPPMQKCEAVLANVKSRFFSCDVAQAADGNWWIIELGDAQVAGLPPTTKPEAFFWQVTERVSHE
ncbi:ATP-grasp domain-containing protein [Bremerella sp. JC817]|uniref:ATP-grasp domain-containing protein n=1 Tax=Bremerella sp. JC817 TaxID=3231756 RepID=UPI00345915FC